MQCPLSPAERVALQEAAVSESSHTVKVSFHWNGKKVGCDGLLSIEVVNLVFKNEQNQASVRIPDTVSSERIQALPFKMRKVDEQGRFISENEYDTLTMRIDQIMNLTITESLFEKVNQKGFIRVVQEVNFKRPQDIMPGQIYRIVFTVSDQFFRSAKLVREPESPQTPVVLNFDRSKVESLLSKALGVKLISRL